MESHRETITDTHKETHSETHTETHTGTFTEPHTEAVIDEDTGNELVHELDNTYLQPQPDTSLAEGSSVTNESNLLTEPRRYTPSSGSLLGKNDKLCKSTSQCFSCCRPLTRRCSAIYKKSTHLLYFPSITWEFVTCSFNDISMIFISFELYCLDPITGITYLRNERGRMINAQNVRTIAKYQAE